MISVSMSASFFWISWFLAKGAPNWTLVGGGEKAAGRGGKEKKEPSPAPTPLPRKPSELPWPSWDGFASHLPGQGLGPGGSGPTHLSRVYCRAVCRQNSAAPSTPHVMP